MSLKHSKDTEQPRGPLIVMPKHVSLIFVSWFEGIGYIFNGDNSIIIDFATF